MATQFENTTKIKYIKLQDKIYQVNKISFFTMSAEASETNLIVSKVPEDEIFDISDFRDFKVKLINRESSAEIIDLEEYRSRRKDKWIEK